MKYNITVNGELFEVNVERADGSVRTVSRSVDTGSAYKRPAAAPAAAPIPVQSAPAAPNPAPAPAPAAAPKAPGTAADITSPMPGNIWKILKNPGDSVKNGEPVIILEAMKMEIEVTATADGVIDKICVNQGQTVNTGDLVATLK